MPSKDIKILVADDSAFMRKFLMDILRAEGYSNFVECDDGNKCLESANTENPDLILLDIIMPGVYGTEVLKQFGDKKMIVVVSAVGQDKLIEEAKDYGAKGYIVKPFDKEQVIEAINTAFN